MYKSVTAFLNLLINQFFFYFVYKIFFIYIEMPKIHQLNIIKLTKEDYKKASERYQILSKEEN